MGDALSHPPEYLASGGCPRRHQERPPPASADPLVVAVAQRLAVRELAGTESGDITGEPVMPFGLLTSGKTTRETAAALFLSPETVEYHLRHVYQRLGIHSREELAQRLGRPAEEA